LRLQGFFEMKCTSLLLLNFVEASFL